MRGASRGGSLLGRPLESLGAQVSLQGLRQGAREALLPGSPGRAAREARGEAEHRRRGLEAAQGRGAPPGSRITSAPVVKPKPSTSQRGYGYLHQQLRARLKPIVEAGMVRCARCGQLIESGERWELDHAPGKQGYLGPVLTFAATALPAGRSEPRSRTAATDAGSPASGEWSSSQCPTRRSVRSASRSRRPPAISERLRWSG